MELRLEFLRFEFAELLRFELLVLLRLDRILFRTEIFINECFYYSVELFCLILLDYSVWKMYQTNFFHFFRNGLFFWAPVVMNN
jgi:hypothetical protein